MVLQTIALPLGYAATNSKWPGSESNQRHTDFQSVALPTELPGHTRTDRTGLEPAASGVTGRRSEPTELPVLVKWAMTGSNRRPPGCKPGALPTELIALVRENKNDFIMSTIMCQQFIFKKNTFENYRLNLH